MYGPGSLGTLCHTCLPGCSTLPKTPRSDSPRCITLCQWPPATFLPRSPVLILCFTLFRICPLLLSLPLHSKTRNRIRNTLSKYRVAVPSRDLELGVMASSFLSIPRLHYMQRRHMGRRCVPMKMNEPLPGLGLGRLILRHASLGLWWNPSELWYGKPRRDWGPNGIQAS